MAESAIDLYSLARQKVQDNIASEHSSNPLYALVQGLNQGITSGFDKQQKRQADDEAFKNGLEQLRKTEELKQRIKGDNLQLENELDIRKYALQKQIDDQMKTRQMEREQERLQRNLDLVKSMDDKSTAGTALGILENQGTQVKRGVKIRNIEPKSSMMISDFNPNTNVGDQVAQRALGSGFTPQIRIDSAGRMSLNSRPVNTDLPMIQRMAANSGIDISGKGREQLLTEIAKAGKTVSVIDPITGKQISSYEAPRNSIIRKGVMSPEQILSRAQAEGEGKAVQKDIESTSKLGTAVKRLSIINKQFNEALPSGDRTPLEQRIYGNIEALRAKYGLTNNEKLVALQRNIRPIAINMIRAFGEVGNLSESEQQGAIDTVSQAGLTDQERIAATRQFIEYALSGARPESIDVLLKRKDIRGILDSFGVDIGAFQSGPIQSGRFTIEVE